MKLYLSPRQDFFLSLSLPIHSVIKVSNISFHLDPLFSISTVLRLNNHWSDYSLFNFLDEHQLNPLFCLEMIVHLVHSFPHSYFIVSLFSKLQHLHPKLYTYLITLLPMSLNKQEQLPTSSFQSIYLHLPSLQYTCIFYSASYLKPIEQFLWQVEQKTLAPHPQKIFIPQSLEPVSILCYMARSDFTDIIKVIDFKIGSLSWTTQVSSIQIHETFLYWKAGEMWRRKSQ